MRRRNLASIVAGLLVSTSLLTLSGGALADERTEARSHFKKGMESIANGKYEEGIDQLKRAFDILPHPNVLYNIARAYVDMGDLENAVVYYRKYLESNPKDRDEVSKIVENLEARIRKQQAKLVESQTVTPGTGPGTGPNPPGTGPGVGPGTGPATGPGTGPGTGPTGPTGPGAGPGEGGPNVAAVKTEDVFAETVVTASKGEQSPLDAPNSTSIITAQDVRLNGKTEIAELFRRLAGVDIMETTGSQTEVSLRGFNQRLSNKVLVLIDGRSVFVDLIGATLWETLSIGPDDIERIEIVRGPGSALYGADAFNGVINIITKKPGEGRSGVTVGAGTSNEVHGNVFASGRSGDFAYRAAAGYDYQPRWTRETPGRRKDIHLFQADQNASDRSSRFDLRTTTQITKDIQVGLGGGFSKMDTMEILAIGPINDFVLAGQASDVTAFLKSKHFEARVFWNNDNVTHGNNAAQIGQTLLPGRANVDVVDGDVQYITQFETGKHIDHDLHLGLGYRYKGVQWTYQDRNRYEHHESAYIHDEIKLGEKFAVVGDYRIDYVPYLEKIVQSPRGSVLFHPTKGSTVRAIVATAFRTPTFLESYLSIPVQLPFAGGSLQSEGVRSDNPNFKVQPEKIFTTELGYLNQDSDFFAFDSAFFYNRANNLIQLAPNRGLSVGDLATGQGQPSTQTSLFPLFLGGFENQCQTFQVYGSELGLRAFPIDGLDLFANYTLNYVKQDNSGCTEEQKSLLVTDKRTSLHKIHVGGQVRTKAGFDFELGFHYYSPQDWAEQIINVQRQRIEYASYHLDQYYTMNATATYRFLQNRANVSFVTFNVLNNEHREHPFGQVVQRKMLLFFGYQF